MTAIAAVLSETDGPSLASTSTGEPRPAHRSARHQIFPRVFALETPSSLKHPKAPKQGCASTFSVEEDKVNMVPNPGIWRRRVQQNNNTRRSSTAPRQGTFLVQSHSTPFLLKKARQGLGAHAAAARTSTSSLLGSKQRHRAHANKLALRPRLAADGG